jgi:hypothetical protein
LENLFGKPHPSTLDASSFCPLAFDTFHM